MSTEYNQQRYATPEEMSGMSGSTTTVSQQPSKAQRLANSINDTWAIADRLMSILEEMRCGKTVKAEAQPETTKNLVDPRVLDLLTNGTTTLNEIQGLCHKLMDEIAQELFD